MQSLAKFQVPSTAFGASVRQLLVHVGVKESAITTAAANNDAADSSSAFTVWPKPGGDAFQGLTTVLSVASFNKNGRTLIPAEPATRAAVFQWCSVATHFSAGDVSLTEIESRLNMSNTTASTTSTTSGQQQQQQQQPPMTFLASPAAPTVADLLLLSALKPCMKQCRVEAPAVFKWVEKVRKADELCATFGSEVGGAAGDDEASAADAGGGKTKGGAAGKDKGSAPTAAEIAARRAEKEKQKAEKAAAAAAAAAGAGDANKNTQPATAAAAAAAGGASAAEAVAAKEKADKEKAAAAKAAKAAANLSPDELDLRIGRIQSIAAHPSATRLFVEQIDLGEEKGPRTIVSGLVGHYTAEELTGALCVVVCNMKPRKLQGIESNGMVLCASTEEAVKLIQPPSKDTPPGTAVQFGNPTSPAAAVAASSPDDGGAAPVVPAAPAAAAVAKAIPSGTKMGFLLEPLRANESGIACWKDIPLTIGGQPLVSPIKNVIIK